MLCFLQTDAEVADPDGALRSALGGSMERITVDGQMSTNDTVLLQATGAVDRPLPEGLLDAVLLQLALEIAADGEGATRVGLIQVREARDDAEAERVARAIGNSPLVKTAIAGEDANWGRVVMAVGKAGEPADRDRLSIGFGGVWCARDGVPLAVPVTLVVVCLGGGLAARAARPDRPRGRRPS